MVDFEIFSEKKIDSSNKVLMGISSQYFLIPYFSECTSNVLKILGPRGMESFCAAAGDTQEAVACCLSLLLVFASQMASLF